MTLLQLQELARKLPEGALDDAVHDCAQNVNLGELNSLEGEADQEAHISAHESDASDVNNGGSDRQVAYLLKHTDADDLVTIIEDASLET